MDRQIVEETIGRARELTSDEWSRNGWDNYDPLSNEPAPGVPGLVPEDVPAKKPNQSFDWLKEIREQSIEEENPAIKSNETSILGDPNNQSNN